MNDFSKAFVQMQNGSAMFVYKVRMFFPRQFHLLCSILLLYLLIVLHNCKKTHISNFMIRLLLLESNITTSFPLGKTRVLPTITNFLIFLLGGFCCKFSGLEKDLFTFKYLAFHHLYCFHFRACLHIFKEKIFKF